MKCEGCQREMEPRKVQVNGHEMDFPYCEACEKQMHVDIDKIKERNVRKRTSGS